MLIKEIIIKKDDVNKSLTVIDAHTPFTFAIGYNRGTFF